MVPHGNKIGIFFSVPSQTQGVVERMNTMVSQTLRCLIHNTNNLKQWEILLPTVELVMKSLPNQSIGFSPFFLNYEYEPVTPIQSLKGDEIVSTKKKWFLSSKGSHLIEICPRKICSGQ